MIKWLRFLCLVAWVFLVAPALAAQRAPTPHQSTPTPRCDDPGQVRIFARMDTVSSFWCIPAATALVTNQKTTISPRWTSLDVRKPFLAQGYALVHEATLLHELPIAQRGIRISKEQPAPPNFVPRVDTVTVFRTDTLRMAGETKYVDIPVVRPETVLVQRPDRACGKKCKVGIGVGVLAIAWAVACHNNEKFCLLVVKSRSRSESSSTP